MNKPILQWQHVAPAMQGSFVHISTADSSMAVPC
jgi:hypothetical protein